MKSQNEDQVRQYPPIQGDSSCDTVLTNQGPGCSWWLLPGDTVLTNQRPMWHSVDQSEAHVSQCWPIRGPCDTVLTNQRPGCSWWPLPGGCCSCSASSATPPPRTSASRARSGPPGAGGEIIVLFTQLYIWKQQHHSLCKLNFGTFRPLLTFTLCTNCTNHIFYFWQFSFQLFLFTCFQYYIHKSLLRAMQTVRFSCKIFFQLPQWS